MTEVFEHNPDDHEDPIPTSTWMVGLVFTAILIIVVLGLTALVYNVDMTEIQRKVVDPESQALQRLHESQLARLTGEPRLEERMEGEEVITAMVIPIDQAMDLIVQEMGQSGDGP